MLLRKKYRLLESSNRYCVPGSAAGISHSGRLPLFTTLLCTFLVPPRHPIQVKLQELSAIFLFVNLEWYKVMLPEKIAHKIH
jgi:hypothetical protein